MESVVQFLGLAFVGIIMICVAWSMMEYVFNSKIFRDNNKLEENLKKFDKQKR